MASWTQYNAAINENNLYAALRIAMQAARELIDQGSLKHAGIWQRAIASVFYFQGRYHEAAQASRRAIDIQPDDYEKSLAFVMHASHLLCLNDPDSAFLSLESAVELARQFPNDWYLWMHLLGCRAAAYRQVGRFEEAVIDWKGCATILVENGMLHRAACYLNNAGLLFAKQEQFREAEDYLLESLGLIYREPHPHTEAAICDSIGMLYTHTGKKHPALRYLTRSLELCDKTGDQIQKAEALIHLAELRLTMKQFSQANDCAARAKQIAAEFDNATLTRHAEETLSRIGEALAAQEMTA